MAKVASQVNKKENGEVDITFTIPWEIVKQEQDKTLEEFAKDITVDGFRKGMAPIEKVKEKVSAESLIQHALSHILPKALGEAINENKLQIALYPRYDLTSSEEGKDWVIVAKTCEIPKFELGNYKDTIKKSLDPKDDYAKKEEKVIKALIDNVKFDIAPILVEEEVNAKLSNLVQKIEKLGLTLEGYLSSIKKSAQELRSDYQMQATVSLKLDFILSRVYEEEKLKLDPKQVQESLKVAADSLDKTKGDIESQKTMIEGVLKKRTALNFLINLK